MKLPTRPMSPLLNETIPQGKEWGYQLKWDGVRLLAKVEHGKVELFSKAWKPKNVVYPEIVESLSALGGTHWLDGEAVVFDREKQRPNFQKILLREKIRKALNEPVTYALFDVLYTGDRPVLNLPLAERHTVLRRLVPENSGRLLVTEMFKDGEALWQWVCRHEWEGIVSKRLSSVYREGKKHKDWYKKKTFVRFQVTIAGLTFRSGRLAGLIMLKDGRYFGRVSLGLNTEMKRELIRFAESQPAATPALRVLPSELKGDRIVWLDRTFPCTVSGLEVTSYGILRHPKIVGFGTEGSEEDDADRE